LIRQIAEVFQNSDCAIFKPISLFACSDDEFFQEVGELPLISFSAESEIEYREAWLHGTPPNGVYQRWDAVVCDSSLNWFMHFQYDFNAGVLGCRRSPGVASVLEASRYSLVTTPAAAIEGEMVWPDGYSETDRNAFYLRLSAEFSGAQ
jgi:hypothetical protein